MFVNLPRRCIIDLWEAFNEVAEGFGLTLDEVQEIFRISLKEYLGYTDKRLDALAETLFHLYDDDRNSLVDSMEFMSSLALISGMSAEEKLLYLFGIYDFEESGELNIDAMTLALRCSMSGLRKLAGIIPPPDSDIDRIAAGAFEYPREILARREIESKVSKEAFIKYAGTCPEISSWMAHFGDLDEVEVAIVEKKATRYPEHVTFDAHSIMGLDQTATNAWKKVETKNLNADPKEPDPWQQVVPLSEPPAIPDQITSAPNSNLNLEWIYGCNTRTLGTRAFYSDDCNLIYPAGAVVVKISRPEAGNGHDAQEFYREHTDYITCVAVYHDKKEGTLVATSQRGTKPKINVWSSERMETLVSMTGFHTVSMVNNTVQLTPTASFPVHFIILFRMMAYFFPTEWSVFARLLSYRQPHCFHRKG